MGHVLRWSALFVVAGAAAWLLARFWRVTAIGAAYKAKVLASTIFGTGRTIDAGRADEVRADSYRALRLFRAHVDPGSRSVTVSFLGLRPRTAIYRAGLGATLAPPGGLARQSDILLPPASAPPWPEGGGSAELRRVVESAFSEPDPGRLRRTRAVVVVHDGRIVAERYAPGFTASTRLPGWSMTKSVLGALIGILVADGRLSLQDRELLPQWRAPDPRAEIRLEDLLRMRSGLRFSEAYSDLSSDVIEMLFNRPDTATYAADQPLSVAPGTAWSYSSGTTNILSGLIRRAVGEADYLGWPRRVLFDPIGMNSAFIEPDASGTYVGSSFMLATVRDWARFGQLYLQDGLWDGQRIVPEEWVRFCTSPTPQSPGGIYGAHWWLKLKPELGGETAAAARIPPDAFFAVGHEGQTLTVVPSLRLVVVRLGLSIYLDAWNHAAFLADVQETF
ncbi:MAG: serine hydrolase [Luteitalea sp.]|nr:serine hydrolase [Luteitalea sp.]